MQLNMVNQVDFIGWTDQAIEYTQKSKVLVLPSQTEGFGLVIGEALLNGTQVVTYNCSEDVYHQLFTADMQRGLVETNNHIALKNTIEHILEQPYQIPKDLSQRYDIEKMAQNFIQSIH